MKAGKESAEGFWTGKGVRQRCPRSQMLFNLLTADMEEKLRKGKWGGVRVGQKIICTLAYADDVVVLAESEEEMESMIRRLEGYFEKRKLEVNVGKTKTMRFRKGGGGRSTKIEIKGRGRRIEEVTDFKYLGYVFKRNGGQEANMRDRVRRAAAVMRQL